MNEPNGPAQQAHAIHTPVLIDCSSSIRTNGLLPGLIEAANETLAELRKAESLVSVVYFNHEIGVSVWRRPARDVPPFSEFNVPIDGGTYLYRAITMTVNRLIAEHDESKGETNADVNIMVFTDGLDSSSMDPSYMGPTLMDARLALGNARGRGFRVTFVTAVDGLASDLGISQRDTILISASPKGVREGFRQATMRIGTEDLRRAAEAMRLDREAKARAEAAAAPQPAPPPAEPAKKRRPWWRFW